MTWIMILLITTKLGVAVTTAEFTTKDKCEQAGKLVDQTTTYQLRSSWLCVEK